MHFNLNFCKSQINRFLFSNNLGCVFKYNIWLHRHFLDIWVCWMCPLFGLSFSACFLCFGAWLKSSGYSSSQKTAAGCSCIDCVVRFGFLITAGWVNDTDLLLCHWGCSWSFEWGCVLFWVVHSPLTVALLILYVCPQFVCFAVVSSFCRSEAYFPSKERCCTT